MAAAEQQKQLSAVVQQAAAAQQVAAGLQVQSFSSHFEDTLNALTGGHSSMQVGATQTDVARVEYFAVPTSNALQVGHGTPTGLQLKYEQYLQSVAGNEQYLQSVAGNEQGALYQAGFQAGLQLCQEMHMSKTSQQLACPGGTDALTTTIAATTGVQSSQVVSVGPVAPYTQPTCATHQVQVATQTAQSNLTPAPAPDTKKQVKANPDIVKVKKGRLLMQRQQPNHLSNVNQQNGQFANGGQNFQIDPNTGKNLSLLFFKYTSIFPL